MDQQCWGLSQRGCTCPHGEKTKSTCCYQFFTTCALSKLLEAMHPLKFTESKAASAYFIFLKLAVANKLHALTS